MIEAATIPKSRDLPVNTDGLPLPGLLALALTGFIAILTETLPAGLLPEIGRSLSTSDSLTGQLVTAYALGSVAAAIPAAVATRSWRRRHVLYMAIWGFLIFNTLTAVSHSYAVILTARFFAGAAAGLTWGLVPVYARQLVAKPLQGRAMAIALVGTPIALSLGVPVGTWLGGLIGWRGVFGLMSVVAAGLLIWVMVSVRDLPGQSGGPGKSLSAVTRTAGVLPLLAIVLTWMLAHNVLYTYVAPIARLAGLGSSVGIVLLAFGLGALAGIVLVGVFVDRGLRVMVLGSLALFSLAALAFGFAGHVPSVLMLGTLVWGLTFGGAATLLQTACADAAGEGADLAQSLVVTVWNLAIAGGGVLGGVLIKTSGVQSIAWVAAALAVGSLVIAFRSSASGLTTGARAR